MTDSSRSDLEAHVDAAAPGVVLYMGVIAAAAALVMEFPLADEVEAAPLFAAEPVEP